MSHPFHYYTPGVSAAELAPGNVLKPDVLERLKLGHLVGWIKRAPQDFAIQEVNFRGTSGAFFTPGYGKAPAPVVSANSDSQTWLQQGAVMIGWETADPPGPLELQRKTQLTGLEIECDGGHRWTVPIARSPRGNETLPADLEWDLETGKPKPIRAAAYDALWKLAGELHDFWHNEDTNPDHDETWIYETALKAMQVNYCIGLPELNAFRSMGRTVINQPRSATIGMILFDLDIVLQVDELKKNESSLAPDSASS